MDCPYTVCARNHATSWLKKNFSWIINPLLWQSEYQNKMNPSYCSFSSHLYLKGEWCFLKLRWCVFLRHPVQCHKIKSINMPLLRMEIDNYFAISNHCSNLLNFLHKFRGPKKRQAASAPEGKPIAVRGVPRSYGTRRASLPACLHRLFQIRGALFLRFDGAPSVSKDKDPG